MDADSQFFICSCTNTFETLVSRRSETYDVLNSNIPIPFPTETRSILDDQQSGSLSPVPLQSSEKQLLREPLPFNIAEQSQINIETWHIFANSNYHATAVFQDPGFDDIFKIMLPRNGNSGKGPNAQACSKAQHGHYPFLTESQMSQSSTNPKHPSASSGCGSKVGKPTTHTSVNNDQAPTKGKIHTRNHSEGKTTLRLAASNGHADIVKCLLDFDVDVTARDVTGATPLHQAAKNGHTETVSVLIQRVPMWKQLMLRVGQLYIWLLRMAMGRW